MNDVKKVGWDYEERELPMGSIGFLSCFATFSHYIFKLSLIEVL